MRSRKMPVRRPQLFALVVVLGSALVLGLAPSAQALANLVPNPGFETSCGGVPPVPCQWSVPGSGAIERDTVNPHTGSASLKATVATGAFVQVVSSCAQIAPNPVTASFWYRTADARVVSMFLSVGFWSSTDCTTGPLGGSGPAVSPIADDVWRQSQSLQVAAPVGTKSVSFLVEVGCSSACSGAIGHFDDLLGLGIPTAVRMLGFGARAEGRGVALRWRTASEVGLLGFDVFRSSGEGFRVINRFLLPADGASRGARYRFADRAVVPGVRYTYRLQAVNADGTRSWSGSASARLSG